MPACRKQTCDSYDESYTLAARKERAGGETHSGDLGEAGGQPQEVTSRWVGVDGKALGDLKEIFGSNPCVPPSAGKEAEEKRAALLYRTHCLTISGDYCHGFLAFVNSPYAGLLLHQARHCTPLPHMSESRTEIQAWWDALLHPS